ncbi:MAG TPA: tetratricopeptide repeat protein [Terriglobales bacterium]|nr:tetratricopeptide repeat protein [Terriglobales bacterium]
MLRCLSCYLWLLLLGCNLSAFAGEAQWVEVRSPHFSVITDAGDKRGRQAALRFEQMRTAFGIFLNKTKVNIPVPLQIVAFRNAKEMRQFVPLWKGKPVELAGLFQGGDDRCFILLDMSVENPWTVVFHEYAHQLQNGNVSLDMQPWFDEGFAEFFSTIQATGNTVDIGRPSDVNGSMLLNNRLMKVTDLFQVSQQSATYNESGDRRSIFYAESWLMVHYIYDNNLLPRLVTYFDLVLNKKQPVDQAIQASFGMSSADLDKALDRYLHQNSYRYYPIPIPPGLDAATFTAKPLAPLDVRAQLADVKLHSADYADAAMQDFSDILKQQPDNQAALRGMGYGYLRKRDVKQAGEYFDKAAQADSNDPRVLYYSAVLARQEGLGSDHEKAAKLQKQMEKAISLDPDFADSYSVLSFILMSEGKTDEAIPVMLKAVGLNPRNEVYSMNLAQLYMMQRKYDEAIGLLTQLTKSSQPSIVMAATQNLQSVNSMKQYAVSGKRVEFNTTEKPETDFVATLAPHTETAVSFMKGKLVSIDCSDPKAADLNLAVQAKNWKLHVKDRSHVLVLGADAFSCDWTNQKIAVNYRKTGDASGDIVSIEVQ